MSASPQPASSSKYKTPEAKARVAKAIERLRPVFAERLSVGTAVRERHGRGEAFAQWGLVVRADGIGKRGKLIAWDPNGIPNPGKVFGLQ